MSGPVILYAALLILPLAALLARRLPAATVVKMASGWLAIFGLIFLAVWWWQG